ncbi:MAG: putative peptide modification system cyclase [Rhodanobacteraceae bacterium]
MNQAVNQIIAPVEVAESSEARLRTLVLCDLVDSTALVERVGDRRAAELFRKHDRLARTLVHERGGREIDKTDGFLLLFERPIQAVAFALDYRRALNEFNKTNATALQARIGIHVGDVLMWDNAADDIAQGAKPVEVEGLVKPITSRLMQLALPDQILMSGIAYALAHRAQGELGQRLETARWRTHGRYKFKGVPDPIAVFEVGEEGLAPLKAPAWSGKAHRELPFWRRPLAMAIEAVVFAALIALPIYYLMQPTPAIAFANRDWVVVGDLRNVTGQGNFDDSLETAFRVALGQSRYVNVLPELKVRQTVRLMERDPDKTVVDRTVGSEIAMRDGARALILPTVAEIGGHVRVTAEVIDPRTQTTVYSESADGVGAQSVLPSVDRVNRQLRERLGEALATVSENSRPLEQVATKNLDALRVYSLGNAQAAKGKFVDAIAFYEQALKFDPEFAAVHLQLGRIDVGMGRDADARHEFELALAEPDRLTNRDRLLTEAQLASIVSPRASLEKWKVLADAWPDYTAGTGSYAYTAWLVANRYDGEVFANARASTSRQNPNRGAAVHLLGILNLGSEHYQQAIASFKDAEATGVVFKPYHAATLATLHNYDAAGKLLLPLPPKFNANPVLGTINELLRITIPLARGDWPGAEAAIARAQGIGGDNGAFRHVLTDVDLSVFAPYSNDAAKRTLAALTEAHRAFDPDDVVKARISGGRVLLRAYLAAHAGEITPAQTAIDDVEKRIKVADSPLLSNLDAVAKSQLALGKGDSASAHSLLQPLLDGSELCIVHVVLLDAYTREGDYAHALEQAQWLASHPGRAYAEYNLDKTLMPFNVVHSNLAWLSAAELSNKLKDTAGARRDLARFRQDWSEAGQPATLIARVKKLQERLGPPPSP